MTERWRDPAIEWMGGRAIIPRNLHDGLVAYIATGRPTGGFLYAVLTNNLGGAVRSADHISMRLIPDINAWLYNYAPGPCHGDEEKVKRWMKHQGMEGKEEARRKAMVRTEKKRAAAEGLLD